MRFLYFRDALLLPLIFNLDGETFISAFFVARPAFQGKQKAFLFVLLSFCFGKSL